jgi:hypothetical protein
VNVAPLPGHRWRVVLQAALRESLRDRGLVAQSVLCPAVVLLLALAVGGLLVPAGPWTVQVGGPGSAVVTAALRDAGQDVRAVEGGALGAPGPGLDATVVVTREGHALVRTSPTAVLAAGELRATVTAALGGAATVEVLGPDGRPLRDVDAFLLPGAVALTAVLLGAAGTAGRVVGWRRRGTIGLLLGAAGLGAGRGGSLRAALVLVPSRWVLLVPAVALATVGAGTLPHPAALPAFLAVCAIGGAACTVLGVLLGCVLRSRREARVVSWSLVVLTAVFGGVVVPFAVLPEAVVAVLRWSPPAVFADGVRAVLTGTDPAAVLRAAAVLATVGLAATVAVGWVWVRAARPRP